MKKILFAWLLLTGLVYGQGSAPVPPARWWNVGDGLNGDSSNVTTTLQAQLNRVSKTTGILVLDSGRYRIDAPIYIPRNTKLVGNKATVYAFLTNDESAFYFRDSGSTIEGLSIKATVTGTQSNGEYGACLVSGKYDMDDTLRFPRRNRVIGCSFQSNLANGNQVVVFGPTESIEFIGCQFKGSPASAHILFHWAADDFPIDTTTSSSVTFHPKTAKITGCFFDTLTGTSAQAIGISAGYAISVDNCIFRDCGMALKVIPGDYGTLYSGNWSGAGGTYIQNENLNYANQLGGISMKNCVGSGLLYGGYIDGRVDTTKTPTAFDSTRYALPVSFENCEWSGKNDQTGLGYYLVYCKGVQINGGSVSLFRNGMQLVEACLSTRVNNVSVFRNTHEGIIVGTGTDTTKFPDGWVVEYCRIYENYTSVGVNGSGNGLYVAGSKDGTIEHNIFGDSIEQYQKWGFFIGGSAGDGYPMRISANFNRVKDCNSGSGHAAFRVNDTTDIISFQGNTWPVAEHAVSDAVDQTEVGTRFNKFVRVPRLVVDSFLQMGATNPGYFAPYNTDSGFAWFPRVDPSSDFEITLSRRTTPTTDWDYVVRNNYSEIRLEEDTISMGLSKNTSDLLRVFHPSDGDTSYVRGDSQNIKIMAPDSSVIIQGGAGNPTINDTLVAPRIHTDTIKINSDVITDFTGSGLSVSGGVLSASGASGNGSSDVDTVGSLDTNVFKGAGGAVILTVTKPSVERTSVTAGANDSLNISVPTQIQLQVGGVDAIRATSGGVDTVDIGRASGQVTNIGPSGGIVSINGVYNMFRTAPTDGAVVQYRNVATDSLAAHVMSGDATISTAGVLSFTADPHTTQLRQTYYHKAAQTNLVLTRDVYADTLVALNGSRCAMWVDSATSTALTDFVMNGGTINEDSVRIDSLIVITLGSGSATDSTDQYIDSLHLFGPKLPSGSFLGSLNAADSTWYSVDANIRNSGASTITRTALAVNGSTGIVCRDGMNFVVRFRNRFATTNSWIKCYAVQLVGQKI